MPKLSINIKIQNKHGIHARPSAAFVKLAIKYQSNITVEKDDREVSGKNIMDLLTLEAHYEDIIKIIADGKDAQEAINALQNLIENKFFVEDY